MKITLHENQNGQCVADRCTCLGLGDKMIEAAPDLLKAARRVLELWDNNGNPAGAFQALRAAIDKAEGR